jgi:N-ethylmaleimide reductase
MGLISNHLSCTSNSLSNEVLMEKKSEQKFSPISVLFTSLTLTSSLVLQNRIVMAPMTRCFAVHNEPTEQIAKYYSKRGGFGLIISEATMIDENASGYPGTPGIFSESQVSKWKKVCDKVHQKGAKFFMQLWHAGVMSHSIYRNGKQPISASDVLPKKDVIPRTNGKLKYETPKPMSWQDIQEIKISFCKAATNAIKAGCDGIELHAANGYLIDSFLHYHSNKRLDKYGGNPENMSRFLIEIIDELINVMGSEKIGVRLSPVPVPSMHNMEEDVRDSEVFIYLLSELKKRGIAYVHASSDHDVQDSGHLKMPVSHFLKKHFGGNVIGCGSYSLEEGAMSINMGYFELIAFGRLSLANPNLVELLSSQLESKIRLFHSSMLNDLV